MIDADPEGWNPIATPVARVYDVAPGTWTSERLQRRFVEAFTYLRFTPVRGGGPVGSASCWPAYEYSWADLVHQQDLTPAEKRDRAKEKNRVRITATAQQIRQVDLVHDWLLIVIGRVPEHARFIVAYCEAAAEADRDAERPRRWRRGVDLWELYDDYCKRQGVTLSAGISIKERVFAWLAGVLNRDKVPVL